MGMIYFHTEDGHILEPILSRCSLLAKTTWVFFSYFEKLYPRGNGECTEQGGASFCVWLNRSSSRCRMNEGR